MSFSDKFIKRPVLTTVCSILIVLVDHDLFRSIPAEERRDAMVYDTRGIWVGDHLPGRYTPSLRMAG